MSEQVRRDGQHNTTTCADHKEKTGRFRSHGRAEAALESIKWNSEHGSDRPTRAYLCPVCHFWFLTSIPA